MIPSTHIRLFSTICCSISRGILLLCPPQELTSPNQHTDTHIHPLKRTQIFLKIPLLFSTIHTRLTYELSKISLAPPRITRDFFHILSQVSYSFYRVSNRPPTTGSKAVSVLGTAGYKGWSVLKATWKEMWLSGMSQLKHGCPRTWCVGGAMSQHKMADSAVQGTSK